MSIITSVVSTVSSWFSAPSSGSGKTVTASTSSAVKSSSATATTVKPVVKPLLHPGQTMGSPIPVNTNSGSSGKTSSSSSSSSSQVLHPFHFDVTCNNLKPSTVHNFYFEGVDVTKYCTLYPEPGSGTVTDLSILKSSASGKLSFEFKFTLNLDAQVEGLTSSKHIKAGDKKFEVKATGSYASVIVPFKN